MHKIRRGRRVIISGKDKSMLTLTRRAGQTIRIGEDIELIVQEVRGSNVRISIVAPKDVKIIRGELTEKKR